MNIMQLKAARGRAAMLYCMVYRSIIAVSAYVCETKRHRDIDRRIEVKMESMFYLSLVKSQGELH